MPEVPTEEAKELLKEFSILYLKNYGATVFEKIKEELATEKDDGDDFKLTCRPASAAVPNLHRFTGECYVRCGQGPGDFSNWKKQFLVERDDNGIDLFADEKAYMSKKKPVKTIQTAGYKVVNDVSSYYANSMRTIANGIGLTEEEVTAMTTFSRYSWALGHPQRTNYIFQLHQGKNSSCACFGGKATVDPDEAGADKRDDIIRYVNVMQSCVSRANKVCDAATETSRIAFRKACQQIPSKIESLKDWSDNGTEGEMLTDLLMEALLPPMRDDIFQELKGPASMKLKLWYKAVGVIQKGLLAVIDPTWEQMQKEAVQLEGKVEAAVRPAVTKIIEVKDSVEEKIKGKIGDAMGSSLGSYVTPFIQPIIAAFEEPLKRAFASGREIVAEKIDNQTLAQGSAERNAYLDGLAWTPAFVCEVKRAAGDVVEPLRALARLSSDVFSDLNPEELQGNAEDVVLQTVDAAAYTVQVRLDNGEQNDEELLQKLLADYDHDAVVKRCEFVKEVARRILIGSFKKLTSPITDPIVDSINDAIPDQMKDFLNIENILDKLIDVLVGTPIDKAVSAAFSLQ